MLRLLFRLVRSQSGTALTEFAFAGPPVILALIGIVEFGRFLWVRNTLEHAVEEAGRYAVLNKDATASDIQTQVRSKVMGVDPTSITVVVNPITPSGNVTFKTITASGTFSLLTGTLLPMSTLSLQAQTRVPVPL